MGITFKMANTLRVLRKTKFQQNLQSYNFVEIQTFSITCNMHMRKKKQDNSNIKSDCIHLTIYY